MIGIIDQPSLYATLPDGKVLGLYDQHIIWHAANQPLILMGEHEIRSLSECHPQVYEITFHLPYRDRRLDAPSAYIDINGVRFFIEAIVLVGSAASYMARGWPISVAHTIPTDETPCFPGWEDVGHEYLDQYDYDHET